MFRFTTLTIFALAATFVAAQDTTTSADTPYPYATSDTCITRCSITAAVSAGCTSTDLTCVCTKPAFQTAAAMCIQQMCPDQLANAQVAFQQNCTRLSIYNGDPYGTPFVSTSGTPATSTSGTSAPGTPAPSTSHPSTPAPASSGTVTPTSSTASSSHSGAAFKSAPVAGAMGALAAAALVGAAIF